MDFGMQQAEARSFMIKFYLEDEVNRDMVALLTNFYEFI
jgi:hypothetical protein